MHNTAQSNPVTVRTMDINNDNNSAHNNNNNIVDSTVNTISPSNINISIYNNNNNITNNNPSTFTLQYPQQRYDFNMSPQPTSTRSMPICPSKINSNKIRQNQQQHWHNNNTSSENMPFSPTSPPIARDIILSPSSSTSRLENSNHLLKEDNEGHQQQMQEIFNKRRRRRESHNLVERRRRDNINEKIQELCSLLPPEVIEMHKKNPMSGLPRSQNSLNKGKILQLSVDHIKDLHNQVLQYRQRISELEQILPISQQQQQQQQQEYSQLHHFNNINPNSSSPMNHVNKDHQFSNFPTKYKYI